MGVLAVPATTPPPSVVVGSPRGFAAFDDRVVSAHAGLVVVRAPESAHDGIAAHAARRLRTAGFDPIVVPHAVTRGACGAIAREIASALGVAAPLRGDPSAVADSIATAADAARATLLVPLPDPATWDGVILLELARGGNVLVVGFAPDPSRTWLDEATDVFELGPTVRGADRLRWLGAAAEEIQHEHPCEVLADLEAWWRRARDDASRAWTPTVLGEDACDLHVALALVGRSVPLDRVDPELARRLEAAGAVRRRAGRIFVAETPRRVTASSATAAQRALARELLDGDDADAWDLVRKAELVLADARAAEDFDLADDLARRAFEANVDGRVAAALADRWFDAVATVTGAAGATLRRRAAERCLAVGDAHGARRWCESASAIVDDAETELLRGRALVLAGDLVAARVALQRVARNAADAELSARVAVEIANLALVAGRHEEATREAGRGVSLAIATTTRLAARNVLGKVLLAQARWDEADAHFAEDGMLAAAADDRVAVLRSMVNRSIAMLESGRLGEAEVLLERVLAAAEKEGEQLGAAFALTNLALIALRRQDYGRALACWEEAVERGKSLYGRVGLAHTLANLAELRLRLGLYDHAEHAVAFGRRLLAGGGATAVIAHYRRVAAQIALARGRVERARAEIEAALGDALASGNSGVLFQVWLVSARVALEEGDSARAEEAVDAAEALPTDARGDAETRLLRAQIERARGEDARASALSATIAAEATGDRHLAAEAHALAARVHREAGAQEVAEAHAREVHALCEQVAASLPEALRATFLERSAVASVGRAPVSGARVAAPAPSRTPSASAPPRSIVGDDPQIRALLHAIGKVARSNSTVLVRGESGTGKELVAAEVHRQSPRAGGPLVSVNCAALVETLLLSELFGHEKGAFTGATARRRGRFEMAEGGTLFLDEIGDISAKTQVALLRVLQEKTFERVGGTTPIRADVRVVCATHRDLRKMVERGEFREDLYYRLNEITLEVPALRHRLGDLPAIAAHLLARIAAERGEGVKRLSREALALLARHTWPGNVRELENVLRATSLFADGFEIGEQDLVDNVDDLRTLAAQESVARFTLRPPPADLGAEEEGDDGDDDDLPPGEATATAVAYAQVRRGNVALSALKRQIERDCIVRALAETKGNITRAAALLGMKRPRLSQLAKSYGLTRNESESS